ALAAPVDQAFLPRSRRQPFSCEAGEGGAQHRMRVRAKRAAVTFPKPPGSKVKSSASLRSRPVIRPPGTFTRKREKAYRQPPSLHRWIKPFSREAEDSPSPAKREKVVRSTG